MLEKIVGLYAGILTLLTTDKVAATQPGVFAWLPVFLIDSRNPRFSSVCIFGKAIEL